MKKITILGASGHGRVIADIAKKSGYEIIEFLDDDEKKTHCGQYPVVGRIDQLEPIENDLFVAIGNAVTRKKIMEKHRACSMPVLVHPDAILAEEVLIGKGTVIMAGVVVNPGATIGEGCIINTCSSIDHDCIVGNYVHIAVGAHLCGTVEVGDTTWIGAGSIVSNNVTICSGCTIGAGALVIKNISEEGTYIGVPCKKRRIGNESINNCPSPRR